VAQREIRLDFRPRPELEVMLEQAALTALNDRNWPLTAALVDALAALELDREEKFASSAIIDETTRDQTQPPFLTPGEAIAGRTGARLGDQAVAGEPRWGGEPGRLDPMHWEQARPGEPFDFRQWFNVLMERLATDAPGARLDIRRGIVMHDYEPVPNQSGRPSATTPCRYCNKPPRADVHLDPIAGD
jgi:hypothetical protein